VLADKPEIVGADLFNVPLDPSAADRGTFAKWGVSNVPRWPANGSNGTLSRSSAPGSTPPSKTAQ